MPSLADRDTDIIACVDCGQSLTTDIAHDAYARCDACSITCDFCEEPVASREELDTTGACPECHIACDYCGQDVDPTDGINEYGQCMDCEVYCDACGRTIDPDYVVSGTSSTYCNDCGMYCDGCGDAVHLDDAICDEELSEVYCESCAPARNLDFPGIHRYDYVPSALYFHHAEGDLKPSDNASETSERRSLTYIGLEVETEAPDDGYNGETHLADPTENRWWSKEDGSLTSGVEHCSHPATYRTVRDPMSPMWGWIANAREDGWRAWNTGTCGLHIHISRRAVTRLGLAKIMMLLDTHPDWTAKLARRKNVTYARPCTSRSTRYYKARGIVPGDKYHIVNTMHRHTIEFRMFRGTLKLESIHRDIDLVMALVAWSHVASVADATPQGFQRWLNSESAHGVLISGRALDDLRAWVGKATESL